MDRSSTRGCECAVGYKRSRLSVLPQQLQDDQHPVDTIFRRVEFVPSAVSEIRRFQENRDDPQAFQRRKDGLNPTCKMECAKMSLG